MLYRIEIPKSIGVCFFQNKLTLQRSTKRISIKMEKNPSIFLKRKKRILYVKLPFYLLKFKRRFLSKLLQYFNTTIKKIENAIFFLLREPMSLVFLIGLGFKLGFNSLKKKIFLSLGYSHGVKILVPSEIQVYSPKENILLLKSSSPETLYSFTRILQGYKKPDAYKSKGVLLNWQSVRKKKVKKNT